MDNESTQGLQLRGHFTRRQIVGAGLAIPALGVVLAACGDDDKDTKTTDAAGGETTVPGDSTPAPDTTGGSGATGGTIRVATTKPASPLDPIAMVDLGTYNVIAQSFEYLTGPTARTSARCWPPSGAPTTTRPSGPSPFVRA